MANYVAIRLYDKNGRIAVPQDCWPVGSIYISVNNVNPTKYFGGTWTAFGTGRTLVGVDTNQTEFNSVEKTGGAKTHVHSQESTGSTAITIAQMPAHRHNINTNWGKDIGGPGWGAKIEQYNEGYVFAPKYLQDDVYNTGGNQGHNHTNPNTNSSSSLGPYITVYFWKRTA